MFNSAVSLSIYKMFPADKKRVESALSAAHLPKGKVVSLYLLYLQTAACSFYSQSKPSGGWLQKSIPRFKILLLHLIYTTCQHKSKIMLFWYIVL